MTTGKTGKKNAPLKSTKVRKVAAVKPSTAPDAEPAAVGRTRARFLKGITTWFHQANFLVGLPENDVAVNSKSVTDVIGAIGKAIPLLGGSPVFALPASWIFHGGTDRETARQTLGPFLECADVIALNTEGSPTLVPVVFADALTPRQLMKRIETLLDLAPSLNVFGTRLLFEKTSFGGIYLLPMLVFFDSKKAETRTAALRPVIEDLETMYNMKVAFVDVGRENVTWIQWINRNAIYQMLKNQIDRLNEMGHRKFVFDSDTLRGILKPTSRR